MCYPTTQLAKLPPVGALDLHVNRDGEVPVSTQLTWQLQALITDGRLQPGERLPSVRRLADVARVNVNTVRAVYERLEGEGFVVTHHGRGTFVAQNVPQLDPGGMAARLYSAPAAPPSRDELKSQISELEAQLSAHAVVPAARRRSAAGPRILSNEELAQVRDELMERLEQLDAMRDDLVDILASLRMAMGEEEPAATRQRRGRKAAAAPRPAPSS